MPKSVLLMLKPAPVHALLVIGDVTHAVRLIDVEACNMKHDGLFATTVAGTGGRDEDVLS